MGPSAAFVIAGAGAGASPSVAVPATPASSCELLPGSAAFDNDATSGGGTIEGVRSSVSTGMLSPAIGAVPLLPSAWALEPSSDDDSFTVGGLTAPAAAFAAGGAASPAAPAASVMLSMS